MMVRATIEEVGTVKSETVNRAKEVVCQYLSGM
jgi:hypothetical protein